MFDHVIAFFRFGLDQKLVDDGGGIGLFTQASRALLQGLGPMRFLPVARTAFLNGTSFPSASSGLKFVGSIGARMLPAR